MAERPSCATSRTYRCCSFPPRPSVLSLPSLSDFLSCSTLLMFSFALLPLLRRPPAPHPLLLLAGTVGEPAAPRDCCHACATSFFFPGRHAPVRQLNSSRVRPRASALPSPGFKPVLMPTPQCRSGERGACHAPAPHTVVARAWARPGPRPNRPRPLAGSRLARTRRRPRPRRRSLGISVAAFSAPTAPNWSSSSADAPAAHPSRPSRALGPRRPSPRPPRSRR